LHESDGREIGRQEIYRLKIDCITMQCAILFKTTAEHKSQQQSKLNYYENTNLKLATGK